jgi:Leucine-rich repeat (LRR) protein
MQLNRDVLSIIIKYNDDYEDLFNLSKLNKMFKQVVYNMSSFEKIVNNFEEGIICINLSKKAKLEITNLNNFTEENIMKLTNNIFYLKLHDLKYMNIINKCILLHTLDLQNTQVIDIAPLSKCVLLHSLNLNNTQVTDITPLSKCVSLHTLDLNNTQIIDIAPLSKCISLDTLYLSNTQVIDIAPLSKCVSLHTLYLHNTQVIDISHLSKCVSLHTLYLYNTQVTQLSITQLKQINPLLKISK